MRHLWTPWRMTYVGGEREPGCVFCNALAAGNDTERLILYRGRNVFAILNLYPYNSGHSMVVPYQHEADLATLDSETRSEMFELANTVVEASQRIFGCDGFNLGLNIGSVAGAGVAEHLHMHVVPRWEGDANFMPILAGTTVMPELLPTTYARLRAELEGIIAKRERGATLQAGGIVVLPDRGAVLLRRGRSGDIVLPKGHLEDGETLAAAALREINEETGVRATITGWAGSTEFRLPDDQPTGPLRYAAYFIATGAWSDDLARHLETDTLLVPIGEAAARIAIPELRQIVEQATPFLRILAGGKA